MGYILEGTCLGKNVLLILQPAAMLCSYIISSHQHQHFHIRDVQIDEATEQFSPSQISKKVARVAKVLSFTCVFHLGACTAYMMWSDAK